MVVATLITLAFGSDGSSPPGVVVDWITDASGEPDGGTPTPRATAAPATLSTELPAGAAGFAYPVAGACLPGDDNLMPGAPREYREGFHEGVDFYDSDNCTSIGLDSPVLAAKAGTVVRADREYQDLTAATLADLQERVAEGRPDDAEVTDMYRGRQVWIDHGGGIVTRYAHLSAIAEEIDVGSEIAQGTRIAYVGESGTEESVTAPGSQMHLHFEIRVGEGYLGQGLTPEMSRRLYQQALSS